MKFLTNILLWYLDTDQEMFQKKRNQSKIPIQ